MNTNSAGLEFYLGFPKHGKLLCRVVGASFQPEDGDLVNIRGKTFVVIGRSFTVDYAGEPGQRVVCNLSLEKVKE